MNDILVALIPILIYGGLIGFIYLYAWWKFIGRRKRRGGE